MNSLFYIQMLLDAYRKHTLPIIHIVRLYLPNGSNVDLCRKKNIEEGDTIVYPGSDGAEILKELKPYLSTNRE